MKKKMSVFVYAALLAAILTGCGCKHEDWNEATCQAPKTCAECGATEGEALEHDWTDASCSAPKTCKTCELTEGEPMEHVWVEATCKKPKHCENCDATEGEALEHQWQPADCETPKKCSVCYKTEGKAKGHTYDTAPTCTEGAVCKICKHKEEALEHHWSLANCTEPKTCYRCDLTEGEALGHTVQSGTCGRCGEEIKVKVLMYSDANFDIYYTGVSEGSLNQAAVNFYAENKSSMDLTIQVRDESINGSMISFTCSSDVAAGKKTTDDMTCSYSLYLNDIGVYSVADIETVEFRFHIYGDDCDDYESGVIAIDVKNGKVISSDGSSSGGSGGNNSGSSSSGESGNASGTSLEAYIETLNNGFSAEGITDTNFEVKTNSSGVKYVYVEMDSNSAYSHLETDVKIIASYNALLESVGKNNEFAVMVQDTKKRRQEWQDIYNDFCKDIQNNLKAEGLNYPVMLGVIDTASGITSPLYLCTNGQKDYDYLDSYMEEQGYVWY